MVVMEIGGGPEVGGPPTSSDRGPDGTAPPTVVPVAAPGSHRSGAWRPLAGAAILERLRTTGRPRPAADPELAAKIRRGLERGLQEGPDGSGSADPAAGAGGRGVPTRAPLVVTKDRLTRVLACEAHQVATEFGDRPPTIAMACGALVDVLFRQLVTVGTIGDPMADGLAALSVDDHQEELVAWVARLPRSDRDELRAEVGRQAEGLVRRWPPLEPAWLPRTQESLRAGLAGGTVELSARVDLAIGRPDEHHASVALVEIKSGARRLEHRADLHFYALVETLRSPAPPFVVATYYARTGELDVDPVTDDLLMAAARRTLAGMRRLKDLADGSVPRRTPGFLCGFCAALPSCEVGQHRSDGPGPAGGRAGS
jgi:hypothetical protein